MEFLNSINIRKNLKIRFVKDAKQSSLYIITIYCGVCGSVCYSKNEKCFLEYDNILLNSVDHLGIK